MKRLLAIVLVTALAPVAAWRASAAEPDSTVEAAPAASRRGAAARPRVAPLDECASTTTTTTTTTTTPTSPDTEPCDPSTTTAPPTTATTTTTTTTVPEQPSSTSTPPETTTPDTAPTTTAASTSTTTPDTAPTTTAPGDTTTTTTTTPPTEPGARPDGPKRPRRQPRDDHESDPVAPPVETPSGRIVVPGGKIDPGQIRSITFPIVGPVTYSNDFGACRDGCRRAHKGNDLIGDRLQPLVAMHDGVIDHLVDHPTAGYGVVIRDAEGYEYNVYHMNNDTPGTDDGADGGAWRFAAGIVPGATVKAGQFLGWMGDSGNSEGSVPHAHVEIRRPDGEAINPFWSLRLAQRDVNCAAGTLRPTRLDELMAARAPAGESAARPRSAGGRRAAGAVRAAAFLASGWRDVSLPGSWLPLRLTGGNPGSGVVEARIWTGPAGYTPVDAAALQVGDPRYDKAGDCEAAATEPMFAPVPAELGSILATIRTLESGGDYTAESRSSTASGAYQFVDSTWGGYGGYARAKDAPPSVQDAKAIEHATAILTANNGDVSTVPVSWYIGHVPVGNEWDTVPAAPGNVLTPREYQARWLQIYSKYVMSPTFWTSGALDWVPQAPLTCRTVVTDLGAPGSPEYVLTQARSFRADRNGLAVVRPNDPCDPSRPPRAKPPTGVVELTVGGVN